MNEGAMPHSFTHFFSSPSRTTSMAISPKRRAFRRAQGFRLRPTPSTFPIFTSEKIGRSLHSFFVHQFYYLFKSCCFSLQFGQAPYFLMAIVHLAISFLQLLTSLHFSRLSTHTTLLPMNGLPCEQ